MKLMTLPELKKQATKIRQHVWQMIYVAQSGHPAGSLGVTDILTTLYFAPILKYQVKSPHWPKRDYFLLSNGHVCPALYATLAEAGFFNKSKLNTLRQLNSPLQGHPHVGSLPGVENTSGPLGQGLSQAVGVALGLKTDKKPNHVFVLTSDGEHQEGQIWEAYMLAAKYALNNLTVIIDRNLIQIDGKTEEVMPLERLKLKLASFRWRVLETDGHNFKDLIDKLQKAKESQRPSVIIAHTTPGKGVSFIENDYRWHGKPPSKKEYEKGARELEILDFTPPTGDNILNFELLKK